MDALLYRFLVTLIIIAAGLALFWGWNRWQIHRLGRGSSAAPGLEGLRPGAAAVLYFTTDDCQVCRTAQKPALEQLQAEYGETVQVVEINAGERPAVADHWGVLSVPTTFIIDRQGQPRRVNHGLTRRDKLAAQLAEFLPARTERHATQSNEWPA
jgi:thiol-disulfide isomerase/thioredoxin